MSFPIGIVTVNIIMVDCVCVQTVIPAAPPLSNN